MKLIVALLISASFNAFADVPNVEQVFTEFDSNQSETLEKKEHRKVFRKHRKYISKCLGIPAEKHRIEFAYYLHTIRWNVLPRQDELLNFFTLYGTTLIKFETTKTEFQSFLDLCENR